MPATRWQTTNGPSSAGYDPGLAGGVDFSAVVPQDNWCDPWSWQTKPTKIAWTTAGAAHDFWTSTGDFNYAKNASTAIGAEVSSDGINWSCGGWDEQANDIGSA